MADDADRAGENTDKFEADAVAFVQTASKFRALIPVGFCHYCGESVDPGFLFCPKLDDKTGCSVDYEFEQARRKAQGQ